MYSEKVMDDFTNPRNVGEIPDANAVGQVGNPQCGDIMKIYMKINDDTQVIEDVQFKRSDAVRQSPHLPWQPSL